MEEGSTMRSLASDIVNERLDWADPIPPSAMHKINTPACLICFGVPEMQAHYCRIVLIVS